MKAKIVIPKGWRRLRGLEVVKKGDRFFDMNYNRSYSWRVYHFWQFGHRPLAFVAIRKVKK